MKHAKAYFLAMAAAANGGAFNGLTLVGDFPEYNPPGGLIMLIR